MKKLPKLVGLIVASSALLFTACTKKPVRSEEPAAPTGPTAVNPDQIATPSTEVAPGTTLEQREPLPPGATEDDIGYRGLMESVYFEFDRSAVEGKEKPKIQAALKYLTDHPEKHILLEGHCDWRGTAEYNLGLGDRRATAVRKYLEQLGVDPKRLEILSKGSQDAKQTGTAADWAKDRRVDFVVLKK